MKKFLALLLAAGMMFSVVACGDNTPSNGDDTDVNTDTGVVDGTDTTGGDAVEYVDPYADIEDYDELSAAIYEDVLGDFATAYEAAKAATNVSERYALMAIAEAKLMEDALMLPLSSNGGLYAISRVAPYTITSVLWGNDSYRYHDALVATEPLTTGDRDEMKAKWAELNGTGGYEAWAKQFLADKGYTVKDSYSLGYASDPQTWDVLATSRAADSEAIINTYDGLLEYDMENVLQPALAESYTVSDDGLTYTFKIKEGLKWVDSQGREVADVKADDFVAGMQHMMDAAGGLEYLVQGIIVNATEYLNGEVEFDKVGVKAVDDTTLVYTLEQPTSYFTTMLGYGVFAPMSREYYTSQGGQFGADFDSSAESYTYGKTPDNIAYCGPYVVTNATAENTIVFSANESYWDAENINIKTLTWLFNDGSEATKAYNDMLAGVIDGCSLNASSLEIARGDGNFDKYGYTSLTDATSFMAFYNVNRSQMTNINDATKGVSSKTEDDVVRSNAALRNVHFRRALSFALDRGAYNAQTVGEDLKLTSLRNSYTPGTFVTLKEDVTVSINGTDKTYPAGTAYGQIMQDQIDADGVKMTVWNPEADGGIGSGDGFDGWYNVDNAKEEMAAAIEELAAIGIEVTAENPIYIDLPYYSGSEVYGNRAQAYKQCIDTTFEGKVVMNLVTCETAQDWYYAGYYTDFGNEANYDIYDVSGWGPDYGDPATYLDTFLADYAGYMVKCIGIY
ncbi:MAG: peptide ABC transporter substrate-binding protein [Clostridia bacterium]|nr:peptide ABC transporter substrate-binding protein [Clostridia bacterium]